MVVASSAEPERFGSMADYLAATIDHVTSSKTRPATCNALLLKTL